MSSKGLSRSEIDAKLRKLDNKLDKLRRDYEQYFVGSRERPPRSERKQVERLVRELEQANVTNTSQRFRLRSLVQRFTSYRQKWNRIQRQIEQGTYEPHKKRAKRRLQQKNEEQASEDDAASEPDEEGETEEEYVVELDEKTDVDLAGLEKELEQMDAEGAFEKYENTEKMTQADFDEAEKRRERASADPSASTGGSDETAKKQKLRKMQEKLGISSGGDSSSRDEDAPSRDGDSNSSDRSASSKPPTGGAKREDLEKLRDSLDEREGAGGQPSQSSRSDGGSRDAGRRDRGNQRSGGSPRGRTSRRRSGRESSDEEESSDDDEETRAEELFRKLVATKREYGESTEHLTLEAVEESMARQRRRVSDAYDADEIDFHVVVKDESVFLQPQLPD